MTERIKEKIDVLSEELKGKIKKIKEEIEKVKKFGEKLIKLEKNGINIDEKIKKILKLHADICSPNKEILREYKNIDWRIIFDKNEELAIESFKSGAIEDSLKRGWYLCQIIPFYLLEADERELKERVQEFIEILNTQEDVTSIIISD